MKVRKPERIELDMDDLESIIDGARSRPVNTEEHAKLRAALDTLGYITQQLQAKRVSVRRLQRLLFGDTNEKGTNILKKQGGEDSAGASGKDKGGKGPDDTGKSTTAAGDGDPPKAKGHGRNGADAYEEAQRNAVGHESLKSGDPCPIPDCRGKVYRQSEPSVIVRIVGKAPLQATVWELERLRCNLCGVVFTAKAPEGIGEEKYDETAASMIGCLRYGAGFPLNRLEKLQGNLGIPLPASTQWDIVSEAAAVLVPVYEEHLNQAAQGEIVHNDDTPARILEVMKERKAREGPEGKSDERTGMFTTGVISKSGGHRIALFFTGEKHAGENLYSVLQRRKEGLDPPIHMCDGLSHNAPKDLKVILSNCTVHARRKYVDIIDLFPDECRYVIETLGKVYKVDATARERGLSAQERLLLHQTESTPHMVALHDWLDEQLAEKKVEPNSPLGEAISYMLKRWETLTLFLRVAGAPLDNNICEQALKMAIRHRKNSLFYKTRNGARVGDIFMTLIHTAELCGANPLDYITQLQLHAEETRQNPANWMPWNYKSTMARLAGS